MYINKLHHKKAPRPEATEEGREQLELIMQGTAIAFDVSTRNFPLEVFDYSLSLKKENLFSKGRLSIGYSTWACNDWGGRRITALFLIVAPSYSVRKEFRADIPVFTPTSARTHSLATFTLLSRYLTAVVDQCAIRISLH